MPSLREIWRAAKDIFGDLPASSRAVYDYGRSLYGKKIREKEIREKLNSQVTDLRTAKAAIIALSKDESFSREELRGHVLHYRRLLGAHRKAIVKMAEILQATLAQKSPFAEKLEDKDVGLGIVDKIVGAVGVGGAIALGSVSAAAAVAAIYVLSDQTRKFATDMTLTKEQRAAGRKAETEAPGVLSSFGFGKLLIPIGIGIAVLIALPAIARSAPAIASAARRKTNPFALGW